MNPNPPPDPWNRGNQSDSSTENSLSSIEESQSVPIQEITSEKNISQILWKSRRLPKDYFNILSSISLFVALTFYVSFGQRTLPELALDVNQWAVTGFSLATGILGFLIAGLAIFSAVSDLSLFTNMARVKHPSGLSYLKYNFITLMYVFAVYLLLALSSFFIQLFSQPNGPLSFFLYSLAILFQGLNLELIKSIIIKSTFVFLLTLFFYSLMLLKNFIFNIYHLIMVIVRWEAEREESRKDERGTPIDS